MIEAFKALEIMDGEVLLKLPRGRKAMFAMTLLFVCILAGASAQICLKHAMNNKEEINDISGLLNIKTIYNIITDKYAIAALMLYGFAFIFWLGALSTLEVSFMYPMLSLAYLLTAVMAFIFLGENIALIRWAGIALIVVGCFLITKS